MTSREGSLILASGSPRRRELLERLLGAVATESADVDETPRSGESADVLVQRLALAKASTVAVRRPGTTVVGADTVVVVDGAVLNKPIDDAEAMAMLGRVSGRTHQVMTGLAVVVDGRAVTSCTVTEVSFRCLEPDEIEAYVATGEPFDKAGAYGIQGRAALFVSGIAGSYDNVVGLPLQRLDMLLRKVGPPLLSFAATGRC